MRNDIHSFHQSTLHFLSQSNSIKFVCKTYIIWSEMFLKRQIWKIILSSVYFSLQIQNTYIKTRFIFKRNIEVKYVTKDYAYFHNYIFQITDHIWRTLCQSEKWWATWTYNISKLIFIVQVWHWPTITCHSALNIWLLYLSDSIREPLHYFLFTAKWVLR